jgi:DNA-binding CsgD family transcriptional regulator
MLPAFDGDREEALDPLWEFVHTLNEIGEEDWLQQIACMRETLSSALACVGVRHFGYHLLRCPSLGPTDPSHVVACYPEAWTERYAAQNYERDDPVLAEAMERRMPFVWSMLAASEELGPRHQQFFVEADEDGMDGSITLPIHVQAEVAALNIVPHRHRGREVVQHGQLLYFMAYYFHLRAHRAVVEVAMATSSRRRSLLSPRETQVLELTARGKSTSEISWELGISHKSVDFHVDGARRKLQVSNRTHAVARALMLGLLSVD